MVTPQGAPQAVTSDSDTVKLAIPNGNLSLEGLSEEDEVRRAGIVFYYDNDSNENDIMDILEDYGRTSTDPDWLQLHIDPIVPGSLGGTYTLNFTGGIRLWIDSGNGTFSYLQSGETFDATLSQELFVKGFSEDGEEEITLDFVAESGQSVPKIDKVKVHSQKVVLQWAKIADEVSNSDFNKADGRLEHEKAIHRQQGAYIPLNNDDDDYNGTRDKDESPISTQENDLLPLYVKKMPKDTGNGDYQYKLSYTNKLRVWKKVEEAYEIVADPSNLTFEPGEIEKTLYVEAVDGQGTSTTVAVLITHVPSGKTFSQVLRVNVFAITGPENVPDYSVYEYRAQGVSTRADTMWVSPGFGVVREGDPTPNDAIDSTRIFWNQSPKIAKARYQATADYVWARDVNVVKIELGEGTLDNSEGQDPSLESTGNGVQAWSGQLGEDRPLQSTYTVTQMQGPTRGNSQQRGLDKMLVGYMQLLTFSSYNASYQNNHDYAHVGQGNTYVDVLSLQLQTTVFPWYDSGNISSQDVLGRGLLRGKDYILGQRQIAMSDIPVPFFPLVDPYPNRTGLLSIGDGFIRVEF